MSPRLFIVPAFLTAFSVVVIVLALQFDLSPPMIVGDSMQPRAFPIFLMVLNLALIAALAGVLIRDPPEPIVLEPFATWGSMGLLGVFYLLTTYVDMFVGIAVVMFAMCRLWGERRLLVAALLAVVTPLSIFLLFDNVLKIRFPRGLLTNWYYG